MFAILSNMPAIQCCLDDAVFETFKVHEKILSILLCINAAGLNLNLAKCLLRSFLQCIIFQTDLRYEPFHSAVVIKTLFILILHITLCYRDLLRTMVPLQNYQIQYSIQLELCSGKLLLYYENKPKIHSINSSGFTLSSLVLRIIMIINVLNLQFRTTLNAENTTFAQKLLLDVIKR